MTSWPPRAPERPDFDVAIIGAGPTGLTAANLLGVLGTRTLLIERNVATVQEPRAVSIDDESLRTMQACGLVREIMQDLALDYGSIYLGPDGSAFARVTPREREYGYPRRNAFRQPLLELVLREGLRRFPHVETRFEHELVSFEQSEDRVRLHLRTPDGGRTAMTASYVAGADGGRSMIRKEIGATLEGSSFEERWLVVDLKQTKDPSRETRVFCDPRRPAISLPGPNRARRYEIRLLLGETTQEMLQPERIKVLLRERGPDEDSPVERARIYTFHARRADRWRERRVLLLGDAAHLTPPFAGQGMNTGIRDAQNFAWKVAAATSGLFGDALLDTYEEERAPHAWSMIELALRMGSVMAPHKALTAFTTRALFRLLSIFPSARDYVAQMRFKPKPRFTSGLLLRMNARSQVGTLFRQMLVEVEGNRQVLLDEVLGHGFSLVCICEEGACFFERLAAHSIWRELGCVRVNLLPRTTAFAAGGGALVVRDAEGFLDERADDFLDRCFVLRPDRYVAAEMRLDEIESMSVAFESLCRRYGQRPRSDTRWMS